jgi:pimeloyl-ACP methyl ester carboxylesterase
MLHFKIVGSGKPIVFLHGFLESISMWETLELEKFPFQSILIDLPGHGKSTVLPETVSIDAMAALVVETLNHLKLDSFDLVGHSMGGYVALQLAKTNPKVDSICLLNSSFWADTEAKKADRNRVIELVKTHKNHFLNEAIPGLFAFPESHTAFIQQLIGEAANMDIQAIVYATQAMRDRFGSEAFVESNPSRIKIIQGELDKAIPLETMLQKIQGLPLDISILKGIGHMSHVEATADVNVLLTDFFGN